MHDRVPSGQLRGRRARATAAPHPPKQHRSRHRGTGTTRPGRFQPADTPDRQLCVAYDLPHGLADHPRHAAGIPSPARLANWAHRVDRQPILTWPRGPRPPLAFGAATAPALERDVGYDDTVTGDTDAWILAVVGRSAGPRPDLRRAGRPPCRGGGVAPAGGRQQGDRQESDRGRRTRNGLDPHEGIASVGLRRHTQPVRVQIGELIEMVHGRTASSSPGRNRRVEPGDEPL